MISQTMFSKYRKTVTGDFFGGFAAMLVVLPSAIAFGLIIYAPLGSSFSGQAVIAGIIGTIVLGGIAPLWGGTPRLISAPCAPAAAVLSVFVAELVKNGTVPPVMVPLYVALVAFFAGAFQFAAGKAGGGRFIKYIPYPVVAGYLSGVGVLIFIGQFPKFIGISKGVPVFHALTHPSLMRWESIVIGGVTIIAMLAAPKVVKAVPASIVALVAGIAAYFSIAFFNPAMLSLGNNSFVIGSISASFADITGLIVKNVHAANTLHTQDFLNIFVPLFTLGVLLSIDTLKTCVIMDVMTGARHNSNKELVGQGIANMSSALLGGIPGSGTMGGTLVNFYSGGKTRFSGIVDGVLALLVLLFLSRLIAWIPVASLAGVMIVVAVRMVDRTSFNLLRHRSTIFDFCVILAVVISAVSMSLIAAAGVGIAMAIVLFLRDQIRFSVVRRCLFGNQTFSKRTRLASEHAILEARGKEVIALELQGQLFFGTADQLFTEMEPYLSECRYLILDMRRVQSVDFTAAKMLKQIKMKLDEHGGMLLFASVPLSVPSGQKVKQYLERIGFEQQSSSVTYFSELDAALEWVEDEYLKDDENAHRIHHSLKLAEFEFFNGASEKALSNLEAYVKEKNFSSGEYVFRQHDKSGEIYFIKKGLVRIELPLSGGQIHHLSTFARGGFFGDMAFLDDQERSADARALGDVELYTLSRHDFELVAAQYPETAAAFYERLAYAIAQRLRLNVVELKALEES